MNSGKARLWAGISCVGTLVTVAVAMLLNDSAHALFAETPSGGPADFIAFLTFFASVALLLLPFDLIGGIWIPVSSEKQTPMPGVWLRRWVRSVGIQVIFYSVTFFFTWRLGEDSELQG
jgi:membrane protease YdiL (CAAX protease family)